MQRIGVVAELWRYPVKSMRGERLPVAELDQAGVAGDRRYAVESTAAPVGKPLLTSRERTAMLLYQGRLQPRSEVVTPEGQALPLPSAALVEELQRRLAAPGGTLDLRHSPEAPITDVRPLSLASTATMQALEAEWGHPLDAQRFRTNLLLSLTEGKPFAEEEWEGATLQFGEAGPQIRVLERIPRCRIVSLDPVTTGSDPGILRHLAQHHQGRLCVYGRVLRPGLLREGGAVFCWREAGR